MKRFILTLSIFLLGGCADGTGTGNPLNNMANAPMGQAVSTQVFATACKILEKCNPGMTDQICGAGLADLTGFGPKLGLLMNPWPTAEQIVTLETQQSITPDTVQGDKCMAQMLKLQCTDSVVQSAYVQGAATPFLGAPDMLDPVCTGVFRP